MKPRAYSRYPLPTSGRVYRPNGAYDSRVFRKSQRFYDAIYAWKDYRAEVERLDTAIRARHPEARTLLDVACGTGKHLELLRDRYRVEGADLDPEMLEIARGRLGPGVPLHLSDMVDFDLGQRFDVVTCLFSSVAYARTPHRLGAAVEAMARHLATGGLLVIEPFRSVGGRRGLGHLRG